MNRCKYCGKPLTLTPEYDTCMECQGRIMREATMPQGGIATNSTQPSMSIYDEAIETLENSKACTGYPCDYPNVIQALERAKKEHTELEAIKRYPTSDEVCEALGKLFGTEFRFIKNRFCFIHEGPTDDVLDSGVRVITIDMLIEKAPHLITLIGRFYEGLEKGEGK